MPRSWFRVWAFVALFLAVVAVAGCQRGKAPPPPMPPPVVTVAEPVLYPVQHYLEYNGFLDAVETVQIKARVKGFLKEIHFKEGDEVSKDDLLYKIDPREYEAGVAKSKADIEKSKADILNSKAQISLAESELERYKRAAAGGVASKSDQDKAQAQLAASQAQLDTATANVSAAEASLEMAKLDLEYTTIKAPISGRISRTQVTKGNLVGQNESTLLTTIVSMDPLYVYFDIPERDLVEYRKRFRPKGEDGRNATPVEVAVATEQGFPHVGAINFRENRVETGTGTIRIRGQIPNPHVHPGERVLYPGLYARVRIPIGDADPQPVIPEEALMTGQEGRFVYVLTPENMVEKRSVTVGPQVWALPPPGATRGPSWVLASGKPADKTGPSSIPVQSIVAIEKGLKAGERIIVVGLQKARPGAPVTPDDWKLQPPTGQGK